MPTEKMNSAKPNPLAPAGALNPKCPNSRPTSKTPITGPASMPAIRTVAAAGSNSTPARPAAAPVLRRQLPFAVFHHAYQQFDPVETLCHKFGRFRLGCGVNQIARGCDDLAGLTVLRFCLGHDLAQMFEVGIIQVKRDSNCHGVALLHLFVFGGTGWNV